MGTYHQHQENTTENATVNATVTSPAQRRVNKWVYVLLAVFLGGLGLHHFYAGKTMKGAIWLGLFALGFLLSFIGVGFLLLGLLWVISIVQAVIALCKQGDENGNIEI